MFCLRMAISMDTMFQLYVECRQNGGAEQPFFRNDFGCRSPSAIWP